MSYLSICIPNYNRIDKLKKLISTVIGQIASDSLEDEVEICVSDDCSYEDPTELIRCVHKQYRAINLKYHRNCINKGMDYNFLNSVMMSESCYCWIIGNDDLPEDGAIKNVLKYLKECDNSIDILVTPFDVYDEKENRKMSIHPIITEKGEESRFDTHREEEYRKLMLSILHNSGLFGFLSNVIFKKKNWELLYEKFLDKLDTVFIQMYMNIQTLQDGAIYVYYPEKIIKNYSDDDVNASFERNGKVLIGLAEVIDYFFAGEIKEHLNEVIVDYNIWGMIWEIPEKCKLKRKIELIDTPKNRLYKKFYVETLRRNVFFANKSAVVFGAGEFGQKAVSDLEKREVEIVSVVDSDYKKQGKYIGKYRIEAAQNLKTICNRKNLVVVVAGHKKLSEMVKQVYEQCDCEIAIIT